MISRYASSTLPRSWGVIVERATSETPAVGSTELWEIINLTADTHPIHRRLAGTGRADAGRLLAALRLAIELAGHRSA